MKQLLHNITITVFEKDTSKIEGIYKTFNELLPIDFSKEKINVKHEKTTGFNEKTIHILSLKTIKPRHNYLLIKNILKKMNNKDLKKIYNERENRLDQEGHFYMRLDKKSLLEKKYVLTEKGDCFHFKIKIAAFPNNRTNLLKSIEKIFQT